MFVILYGSHVFFLNLLWGLSQSDQHISFVKEAARRTVMSAALYQSGF